MNYKITTFIWFTLIAELFATAQNLIPIDFGYSQTSVNTVAFRTNSISTLDSIQYASYYDSDGYIVIARRTLGEKKWEIRRTQYKGNVSDAHNSISIAVDGDGYLHMAFDHHGHRLNYCRSDAPHSLTMGDKTTMTGENETDVTYPEFYRMPDGGLLFAYRAGASGRGNLVMKHYDRKTQRWRQLHDKIIDGENQRNAYWQIFTDEIGNIHLAWVWRETWMVETNHDICYAFSPDGGKNWQRTDGTNYSLPITLTTAEIACHVPQNSELINQTGICADALGHPYIATYWRDETSDTPQYRVVWNDGKTWHNRTVGERVTPFSLTGGHTKVIPIARPKIVAQGNNVYYIFRDIERNDRVSIATTNDIAKGKWSTTDLTDFAVGAWEPTIDNDLWKEQQQLHIFVQKTFQAEGEKDIEAEPQMIYILEYPIKNK